MTAASIGRTFSGYVTYRTSGGGKDSFTGLFTTRNALEGTVRVTRGSGAERCDTGPVTFVAYRVGRRSRSFRCALDASERLGHSANHAQLWTTIRASRALSRASAFAWMQARRRTPLTGELAVVRDEATLVRGVSIPGPYIYGRA